MIATGWIYVRQFSLGFPNNTFFCVIIRGIPTSHLWPLDQPGVILPMTKRKTITSLMSHARVRMANFRVLHNFVSESLYEVVSFSARGGTSRSSFDREWFEVFRKYLERPYKQPLAYPARVKSRDIHLGSTAVLVLNLVQYSCRSKFRSTAVYTHV